MSTIEFSSEQNNIIVQKIQNYFEKELDQELGQFDAEFLLDFFSKEVGAYYYNQGLQDAQAVLEKQLLLSGVSSIAVIRLVISLMILSGCSTVVPDIDEFLRREALQGNVQAQYEITSKYDESAPFGVGEYALGMHYAQAWGTEQALVLAYKWIALANEGGLIGGTFADTEWLIWKGKLSAESFIPT